MNAEERAREAMAQTDGVDAVISFDEFVRHLRAAVAEEREACAQIAETGYAIESGEAVRNIVVEIRTRGGHA